MSILSLFDPEGHWYKANLHCHSTVSDGRYTPEHLREIYRANGYAIVAFSDHNKLVPHTDLKTKDFLPITACEIDITQPAQRWQLAPTYHINLYSKDENRSELFDIDRTYCVKSLNRFLADGVKEGFLTQYNHPRWSLQTVNDFVPLTNVWGFEVFNTGCQKEMGNGWGDYEYECACRYGAQLPAAIATDDNHNVWMNEADPNSDSFGGFTMVRAASLDYSTIMDALERKQCYASTHPLMEEMYVENGILHLTCSPCHRICLLANDRIAHMVRATDDTLTNMEVDISQLESLWVRVECADAKGKAMTRAFTRKELGLK